MHLAWLCAKNKGSLSGLRGSYKGEGFMSFSRAEIELPKRQKRRGGLCLGQRTRSRAASCSHRLYCFKLESLQDEPAFLFGRRPCVGWWVLGDSQTRGTMVTILKPPFFTGLDLGSPLLRERGSGFVNVSEPPPRYGTLQNPQGHDLAKGLCTANQRSSPTTGPNHLEECGAT